jgi:hypothetical protein
VDSAIWPGERELEYVNFVRYFEYDVSRTDYDFNPDEIKNDEVIRLRLIMMSNQGGKHVRKMLSVID